MPESKDTLQKRRAQQLRQNLLKRKKQLRARRNEKESDGTRVTKTHAESEENKNTSS